MRWRKTALFVWVPRYEDICANGGLAPRVLNVCPRWTKMHEPSVRLNYSLKYPLDRSLCSSGPNLDAVGAGKFIPLLQIADLSPTRHPILSTHWSVQLHWLFDKFVCSVECTGNLEEWGTCYRHTKLHTHLTTRTLHQRKIFTTVIRSTEAAVHRVIVTLQLKTREILSCAFCPVTIWKFVNGWVRGGGV